MLPPIGGHSIAALAASMRSEVRMANNQDFI
jgi:hypothetical protein